jgi:hypothetical protein
VFAQGFDMDLDVQTLFERLVPLDAGPLKHQELDRRVDKRKISEDDERS